LFLEQADFVRAKCGSEPVNLEAEFETTIKNLVDLMSKLMDFKGKIEWDRSKSDGLPRRMLDVSQARKLFDFGAKTEFEDGLKRTIEWHMVRKDEI
jgi:GDP-L-fucose synthase